MKIDRISIVGMGALGTMFGGFFTEKLGKENVEFIADGERIKRYKEEGVYSNGKPCDFNFVDGNEKGRPAELLIFAVKQTALDAAIKIVANKVSDNTIIISLLNGISSEEVISSAFGEDKVLYTIAEGMDAVKIGNQLTYTTMGYLWLGSKSHDQAMTEKLNSVVELFDRTGFPYKIESDIMTRLWSKFMLNVGVNQVVMMYEGTYGTIQKEGGARDMMTAAMKEVIGLAEKENINIGEDDFNYYLSLLDTLSPNNMPSMRQDGLQKRKSEVELFSGTVVRLGKKHNFPTPVNDQIYQRIREMEKLLADSDINK